MEPPQWLVSLQMFIFEEPPCRNQPPQSLDVCFTKVESFKRLETPKFEGQSSNFNTGVTVIHVAVIHVAVVDLDLEWQWLSGINLGQQPTQPTSCWTNSRTTINHDQPGGCLFPSIQISWLWSGLISLKICHALHIDASKRNWSSGKTLGQLKTVGITHASKHWYHPRSTLWNLSCKPKLL